jgi:hypothetical protein
MSEITSQIVSGEVKLDGKSFKDCEFRNARLIYEGGPPPQFANCRFTDSRFTFQEQAGNTLLFLRAMLPEATNMREVVLGLMPEFNGPGPG